jgi:DNA-binding XRE family transcriptional regulator
MMKLKDKMTPAELADCLGLARQTINRWVREKQWRTKARNLQCDCFCITSSD